MDADPTSSAAACRAAFELLMRGWTAFNQEIFELREGPQDLFGRILATVSAGVYLPDLHRFQREISGVDGGVAVAGNLLVSTSNLGTWTRKTDAEKRASAGYALDFVSGLALQIEAQQ